MLNGEKDKENSEIVVTEAMIEAGVSVLEEAVIPEGFVDSQGDEIVRRVFLQMSEAIIEFE